MVGGNTSLREFGDILFLIYWDMLGSSQTRLGILGFNPQAASYCLDSQCFALPLLEQEKLNCVAFAEGLLSVDMSVGFVDLCVVCLCSLSLYPPTLHTHYCDVLKTQSIVLAVFCNYCCDDIVGVSSFTKGLIVDQQRAVFHTCNQHLWISP